MRNSISLFTFFLPLLLLGCVGTFIKGYTDLNYPKYKIEKIMVRAPNAQFHFAEQIENSIVAEFIKYGIEADSYMSSFPPTRKLSNQELVKELKKRKFDTIMYVNLTDSSAHKDPISYVSVGNGIASANSLNYGAVSMPFAMGRRETSTRVTIYHVNTADVIWIGDANTKASGSAYMDDEDSTDSLAEEILEELNQKGHT